MHDMKPHNPTGMVFSKEQIQSIVDVLSKPKNKDILVVSDEVYEDLVFEGAVHHHIATFNNGAMFDRTITVNSAAKKFSVTGWKIGFCIGPPELVQAINFVTRAENWCQASAFQVAVARMFQYANTEPYEGYKNYWEWLPHMYSEKRDMVIQVCACACACVCLCVCSCAYV